MKRALLIATGTVGGLGAVLAITPPQLSSSEINLTGGAAAGNIGTQTSAAASSSSDNSNSSSNSSTSSSSPKAVATATATKSTKPVATKKAATSQATAAATSAGSATKAADPTPSAPATKAADPSPAVTKAADPTPAATKTPTATKTTAPTTTSKGVTGTFTGPAVFVNYGTVQVKITVSNGRITDAVAVQAPTGRNDRYTQMAVPILKQQTLAAQSANIKGASGASYTSYGWYKSLQGALADAGL